MNPGKALMARSAIRRAMFLALALLAFGVHALSPSQVFNKVKASVVVVKAFDAKGEIIGQGSGVILPSGKIGTNCHVVKNGASFQVGGGKQFVPATLWGSDEDKDICLLEAGGLSGEPAQLGQASRLKVGEPVYAVGAPRGLELSLSDGIVSQLRGGPPPFIQTTAAISPGSSGGGLFDAEGRLVGFTTLYIEGAQSLNFAMPVEWAGEIQQGNKVAQGRSVSDWGKRAYAFVAAENWTGLRGWCQQWTQAQPEKGQAWSCLGVAYDQLKRYTDAIEAYRQLVRIDSKDAGAWSLLGFAYHELKRYTEAIEAYRQAVRIDSKNATAWFLLGYSYAQLERHTEAIEAYRQGVRIDSKDATAWFSLGSAYRELKRYTEAIEAYRQAVRIDSKNTVGWWHLGSAYSELKRYPEAIEAYRQAVRIDTNNATVWFLLGRAFSELKRYTEAIEAYRQIVRIDSKDAGAWRILGSAYRELKRYTEAIEAYRQAIRMDPKDAGVWLFLGFAYRELKRYPEAIEAYQQSIRIDPKETGAWSGLVLAYEESGNRTAALEALSQLRRIGPATANGVAKLMGPRAALRGSAAAGWVFVINMGLTNDNYDLYIDPTTIRKEGNMVKIWEMKDYKTAKVDAIGRRYLSEKQQDEYDCKDERMRILALVRYAGNKGGGDIVYLDDGNDPNNKGMVIVPGSIGETNLKLLCGKQ